MKSQQALTDGELRALRAAFPCQFYRDTVREQNHPYSYPVCLWLDATKFDEKS